MRKNIFRIMNLFWMLLLAGCSATTALSDIQNTSGKILLLKAEGALTPAMEQYIARAISSAESQESEAIIIQLNTPGGSIDLMDKIVQRILVSEVPVIVYVTPRGAQAASAGTIITLAAHQSAMAPYTVIGAASPVGSEGEDIGETMQAKVKNDLKAKVRELAKNRGDEAIALAQDTIENATAVSATEALDAGLVDFIADDVNDLLQQMDGKTITLISGERTLHTSGIQTEVFANTFIEEVLHLLTNPNIVFLLITIGVQAILIELSNPGGWFAGFLGAVCLALAVYGLGILPVNWFGIIFLIIAFVLFVLDIKAPTHGALTIAGVGSFIAGGLILFNSPGVPSFQRVSVPLVVGASLVTAAVFFVILTFAIKAQRRPVNTGREALVGKIGIARTELNPEGTVQVGGELWSAESIHNHPPISSGSRVEILQVEGIRIIVKEVTRPVD